MGAFLAAHGGDILVSVLVLVCVIAIVRHMVRNKKAGGCSCGGCSGDCAHCSMHH